MANTKARLREDGNQLRRFLPSAHTVPRGMEAGRLGACQQMMRVVPWLSIRSQASDIRRPQACPKGRDSRRGGRGAGHGRHACAGG